jgi:hypothetical protein
VIIAATLWPSHTTNTAGDDQVSHDTSASTKTTTQNTTQATNTATAATTTPATTASTVPPPSPSTNPGSGANPFQWQGAVVVTSSYTDLDSVPVNNGVSTLQDGAVYDSTDAFGSTQYTLSTPSPDGLLSVWSGSTPPTRTQCYDQVSSQGVQQATVVDGTMVCLITPGNRVALLTVLDDQADNNNGIKVDADVWSQIASTSPTASAG